MARRARRWIPYPISFAAAAVLLSACSSAPDAGQARRFDEPGSAPTGYEQAIRTQLRGFLRDPDGVKDLKIAAPVRSECAIDARRKFEGWKVAVSLNARNADGEYSGPRNYYYWFQGEKLWGLTGNPDGCPPVVAWR
ncbi:MAG: hypothetical protein AB7L76_15420 [Burkholderiaceae bacterium]